jgi:PAS domain S-box-containing protein
MKEAPAADPSLLEESIEELYEHASCGYLTFSDRGTILKLNQTLLNWLGYERSDIAGRKTFQDLLTFGSKVFLQTHIHPLVNMQGFANEIYFDLVAQDKSRIPALTSILRRSNQDGSSHVYKVTLFNISDRKSYERELIKERDNAQRAAAAKAEFLSMMSHEIRTPMNAVIGIANLLEATTLNVQQTEYLDLLKSSAESLMDLLNSILDFSKIESGKDRLEQKAVALKPLIWSSVRSLEGKARQKNLPIRVAFHGDLPLGIITDPIKLGQILNNLLGNAIKFTETGGVDLVVSCLELYPSRCVLKFEVVDSGIGIREDRLQTIFGEFSQADSEITMKYGGSGLGLAISSKLTELLGGKLEVASTWGEGSTFSFILNFSIAENVEEAVRTQPIKADTSELKGLRILVAEDNAANVYILEKLLSAWSVTYTLVANGMEALDALRKSTFDLLLLDLRMPVMDGFETARRIREDEREPIRNMPILAFSASSQHDSHLQGKLADFDDCIGKPFRPVELYQKILLYKSRVKGTGTPTSEMPGMEESNQALASASQPLYTLELYKELLDHDHEAVREIIELVIESLKEARNAFEKAIDQGDEEEFGFYAHRIQVSLEMLQARPLQRAIAEARRALPDESARRAAIDLLCHELDLLCSGLEAATL